jgi:hypothetical protein
MSIGGVLSSIDTQAEAAARRATYNMAKDRIAAIQAREGHAAPQGSTAPSPFSVGKALENGLSTLPGIGPFAQAAGTLGSVGESIGGAAGKSIESAATLPAEALAEGLFGIVKPVALKLTLYAVLIFGGIALAGYGLATMLKPEPPSLKGMGKLSRVGKLVEDNPELALAA